MRPPTLLADSPTDPDRPIFLALYADEGTWEDGLIATESMWHSMGVTTQRVTADEIRSGILEKFDVLEVPGGWAGSYHASLGTDGQEAIQKFVNNGGGYIGVCAGAYLASSLVRWDGSFIRYHLDLVRTMAVGPIDAIAPWPDYAMTAVDYQPHPITDGLPNPSHLLYYGGAYFISKGISASPVDATYEDSSVYGMPAMLAKEYGLGRIFLTALHPEIEEGSDRDGVTGWDDFLLDPESDWPLMGQALHWLME
jgi:glutamine amidotransferase-like uncharacterized protein